MPVETFWDGLERRIATGDALSGGLEGLNPPPGVTPEALRRILDLEAHHLRDPDLAGRPAALPQQLLARAVATGESALAGAARKRIDARGLLVLATRWRTRPASAALRRILDGHGDAVTGLILEPGGRLLSVDASGSVLAWDTGTGLPAGTDPVAGACGPRPALSSPPVRALAVSDDGGLIAVAQAGDVVRVLAGHGAEVGTLTASGDLEVLTFACTAAGATRLAGGAADGTVRIWDVIDGTAVANGAAVTIREGHTGPVRALVAGGPGTIVSGGADGALRAWDVASGALLAGLEGDAPVTGLARSGAAELLVTTADGGVHLLDLVAGVPQGPERLGGGTSATAAAAAGTGSALVARADGVVELWRTGADEEAAPVLLAGHGSAVRAAALGADGTTAATGDDHGRILVWDTTGVVDRGDRPGLPAEVGAIAVAGDLVVSAARDAGLLLARDRHTGDERWRCSTGAEHVWSDTGGTRLFTVADGSAGRIDERHAATGVRAGSVGVKGTVLTGRGTLVVLGGTGQEADRVAVADARTGREFRSVQLPAPARRAALTPGGSTVLLGSDTALTVWHTASGELQQVPLPGSQLVGVAIDDDGCHAVAADANGRVHAWAIGAATVTTVRADPVLLRAVTGMAGHRAVTAGSGGSVLLWDLTRPGVLGRAPLDAPLTAVAAIAGQIAVGDACGDTHCLDVLEGAPLPAGTIPEQGPGASGRSAIPGPRAADAEPSESELPESSAGDAEPGTGRTPLLRRLLRS
ncbi:MULTISPECIES: WD40 repeat domain-containing protein [Pseudonocardia]|uniref:WD domain, G-beta repeat n=2 Tax=Pseudonocardia TaxID=1847 RepID=A0A1Y2MI20_PSEAH|nr:MULTISPECIES: hypothetical protein [Pseudonocardia]OSY34926.1 WD domain, G-beta repeat [Pseudonocardia autotrophica]TDN76989.1 WD40 repeat protein [Pseudonocardia autotrophica]BBG00993.1 hypothetical protein Pdca_22020 [Pseudonocardia autotrophica]GEC29134.1 hypothetical protein PSA01_61630 [Pseudonocardia saturnea]